MTGTQRFWQLRVLGFAALFVFALNIPAFANENAPVEAKSQEATSASTKKSGDQKSPDEKMTKQDAKKQCRNEGKRGFDLRECIGERTSR